MSIDQVNTFLDALAGLNDGPDHGSQYSLTQFAPYATLIDALGDHFGQMHTSRCPPQKPEAWNIQIMDLGVNWRKRLSESVQNWFFGQDYSPKVARDWSIENTVSSFMSYLESVVKGSQAYEVSVNPPGEMWYECFWQDFAFSRGHEHWLLHFGFSD